MQSHNACIPSPCCSHVALLCLESVLCYWLDWSTCVNSSTLPLSHVFPSISSAFNSWELDNWFLLISNFSQVEQQKNYDHIFQPCNNRIPFNIRLMVWRQHTCQRYENTLLKFVPLSKECHKRNQAFKTSCGDASLPWLSRHPYDSLGTR